MLYRTSQSSAIITLAGLTEAQSNSVFLCQRSAALAGDVYTPNIPDLYFNRENTATFSTSQNANLTTLLESRTYFFTIPRLSAQRNCSGTFTTIQYCYQVNLSTIPSPIFSFYFATREGSSFTVDRSFLVTPSMSKCTSIAADLLICCETRDLSVREQISIRSSEFTFGLVSRDMQFISFADSATEFNVERAEVGVSIIGLISGGGLTISGGPGSISTDQSIVLFRFLMGKIIHL